MGYNDYTVGEGDILKIESGKSKIENGLKKFLFTVLLLYTVTGYGFCQSRTLNSLDDLFAGIPLNKSYNDWVTYINQNSNLGIDSIRNGLICTSPKSKILNYPFPDSLKPFLSVRTYIKYHPVLGVDTISGVGFSAVFGTTKQARKEVQTVYKELRNTLKSYYRSIVFDGMTTYLNKGLNKGFPDFEIVHGKLHSNDLFGLILSCEIEHWSESKPAAIKFTKAVGRPNIDLDSADELFAGIPIKQKFEKWVDFVNANPGLIVDSISSRGYYLKIDSAKKSLFPFSEADKVKLLLVKAIGTSLSRGNDTVRTITVEGVFGNDINKARQSYADLRVSLEKYYGGVVDITPGDAGFAKGASEHFPNIELQLGYFEEMGFYYVAIICIFNSSINSKYK